MKTIWILNHYASNQFLDHGGRHYFFAKYLMRTGYSVKIFCAKTIHNSDKIINPCEDLFTEDSCDGIPFVFIKARKYEGNGKQRVLNMLDFYINMQKAAKHFEKPDIIIGSSVHPLACVAAIRLSNRFKCKSIVEIRDLWPESIVAYGIAKESHPLVKLLYRLEKWIYTRADSIIFTMEGGKDYIIEKGWDKEHGGSIDLSKVHHINNGVDLETFDYDREHYSFTDADLDNPDTFKVVYTGSIRKVNNLDLLLDTAKLISDPRVKFIIWGDGNELAVLQQRVVDEEITNVVFKGYVGKNYVPSIVSKASLNILHGGYTPIMRYGASPNKLFEYLAAGHPILSDLAVPYDVIIKYHCGQVTANQDTENIADEISRLVEMEKGALSEMADNARLAARDYDYRNLTQKLIQIMNGRKV